MAQTQSATDKAAKEVADNTNAQSQLGWGAGVSANKGVNQNYTRGQDEPSSKIVTYKRCYYHFLGPGTDGIGFHAQSDMESNLCWGYDWGCSALPFNNARMALTPKKLMPDMSTANSFQLLSHSVTLTDLICSRDEIQSDGRIVTTIQPDTIEIYEDKQNKFRAHNFVTTGSNQLFTQNMCFNKVEPDSVEDSLLTRVKILFPPEHIAGTLSHNLLRGQGKYIEAVDPYNGFMTLTNWHGGDFHRSHQVNSPRLPICLYADATTAPANANKIQLVQEMIATASGIYSNVSNQVNHTPIIPPNPVLMRFAPFWTANGKAQRRAQFKAIYSITIKYYYSADDGTNMLHEGNQYEILAGKFNDPWSNARSSLSRFAWGTHPEDFSAPIAYSYQYTEDQGVKATPIQPESSDKNTDLNTLNEVMTDLNINVRQPPKEADPQQKPVTQLETEMTQPKEGQLPPQYSAEVLKGLGINEEVAKDLETEMELPDAEPVDDPVVYQLTETTDHSKNYQSTLVTDDQQRPQLPITITPKKGELKIDNIRYYRPAELWKEMQMKVPLHTKHMRSGTEYKYVPWPRMKDSQGNRFAQVVRDSGAKILDLPKLIVLNKDRISASMRTVNRAIKLMRKGEVPSISDAIQDIQTIASGLPPVHEGPKEGPPMPKTPVKPADVEEEASMWSLLSRGNPLLEGTPPSKRPRVSDGSSSK